MTEETPPTPPADSGEKLADRAKDAYRWWDNLATLNENDPFLVGVGKIGLRVVGIIVLLALSPFILMGLMMAFIAVA